jgi:Fe-S-cluster containining protein
MDQPFYADGLRFGCERCSSCCRHDPGFVFLTRSDAETLAAQQMMGYNEFVLAFCRWIPAADGSDWLSLREKSDYDCVFWAEAGCSVYEARPIQCRSFPFWESVVQNAEAWAATGAGCPGIGRGERRAAAEIAAALERQRSEPIIARRRA